MGVMLIIINISGARVKLLSWLLCTLSSKMESTKTGKSF